MMLTPSSFFMLSTVIQWICGSRDWLFSSTQAYTQRRQPMQRDRSRP